MLSRVPLVVRQVRQQPANRFTRTLVSSTARHQQHDSKQESHGSGRLASAVAVSAAALVALQHSDRNASCYYDIRADGSVDRMSPWKRLWEAVDSRGPAFHSRDPQKALLKYLSRFGAKAESGDKHILVPMCGKSGDIPHLSEHGFNVVGVECAQKPIFEFFAEQRHRPLAKLKGGLQKPERWSEQSTGVWENQVAFKPASRFEGERPGWVFKRGDRGLGYYSDTPLLWRGYFTLEGHKRSIDIIQADMFTVEPSLVACATDVPNGLFQYVYDRAAFATVPPSARSEYVSTISTLMRPRGKLLLVTVDYERSLEDASQPRHYSISLSEVKRLFPGGKWTVEELGTERAPYLGGDAVERVFMITKKDSSGGGGTWKLFAMTSLLLSSLFVYRAVSGADGTKPASS